MVSSIVGTLLFCGTIYELVLRHQLKLKRNKKINKEMASDSSSGINCTTYDLTDAVPKNDSPIGIVIPRNMNNNNSDENLAVESSVISESDDVKLSKCLTIKSMYISATVALYDPSETVTVTNHS